VIVGPRGCGLTTSTFGWVVRTDLLEFAADFETQQTWAEIKTQF
jgi:hypothetical protein